MPRQRKIIGRKNGTRIKIRRKNCQKNNGRKSKNELKNDVNKTKLESEIN